MKSIDYLFWFYCPIIMAIMIPVHIITGTTEWLILNLIFWVFWIPVALTSEKLVFSG